ncbi:MAG: VanZ family protein [Bacteroidetes bacterium]|nr:VanZ family protein [Bacteroidota bacterium]
MKAIKHPFTHALLWLIIVTVLLTLPGKDLPNASWMDDIHLDKFVHVGLFSALTFLWCRVQKFLKKNLKTMQQIFMIIALVVVVYGTGMEFVQKYFIPNRSFDTGDILADAIGSLIGFLFATKVYIKK